jgi:chromatin remodeling complex protein RSC6
MAKAKKAKGIMVPVKLSTKLKAIVGNAPLSRPEVMKKIWAYIKKRNLQHPKDTRCIRLDPKLSDLHTIFTPVKSYTGNGGKKVKAQANCISMFDMSKQLAAKHIESKTTKVNPIKSKYIEDDYEDDDYDIESNPDYFEEEEEEDDYDIESNPEEYDEYDDEEEDDDY